MPSTRSSSASTASPSVSAEPLAVSAPPPAPPPPPPPFADAAPSSSKRPSSTTATTSSAPQPKRPRPTQPAADLQGQGQAHLPSSSRLPLQDAEVYYLPEFVTEEKAAGWYDQLVGVKEWYQPTLKMYGKEITQSRKIAAYSTDPTLSVRYSGAQVQMHSPYPPLLAEIQGMVEKALGTRFNHCMMNLYEDGNVYIGNHRDNKENRVIASLSLGAERTFILTHDAHPKSSPTASLPASFLPPSPSSTSPDDAGSAEDQTRMSFLLRSGSLLVMQGNTQQKWKHEIPKEFVARQNVGAGKRRVEGGRISLTFRQLSG